MSQIDEAAALAAIEPDPEPQQAAAFVEEHFMPMVVNVIAPEPGETPPGEAPVLMLQQFVGPIRPGVFQTAKVSKIFARDAIAIGEHLADQGRKALTGLIIARPHGPAL